MIPTLCEIKSLFESSMSNSEEEQSIRQSFIEAEKQDKWISAGGVVFDGQGNVCLVSPTGGFSGRKWTFPKGRVDEGESVRDAAIREVAEEAGIHASIISYIGAFPGDYNITHYYVMRGGNSHPADEKEKTFEKDDEMEDMKFVPAKEAFQMLNPGRDRKVLSQAL